MAYEPSTLFMFQRHFILVLVLFAGFHALEQE